MGFVADAGTAVAFGGVTDAATAAGTTRAEAATAETGRSTTEGVLARNLGPRLTSTADDRLEPLLLTGPLLLFVEPAWLLDGPDPADPPVSA